MQIKNQLEISDLSKLKNILTNGEIESLEILPEVTARNVKIEPLKLEINDGGYLLSGEFLFRVPIGNQVCDSIDIEERGLSKSVNRLELSLRQPIFDEEILENDLSYAFLLIDKLVNHCAREDSEEYYGEITVNSALLDRQIQRALKTKDMEQRKETYEAFAVVHADSGPDLRPVLPQDLVPVYEEYDRFDLHGAKKAFRLLPRKFVNKLLKCEADSMIPEDFFEEQEKTVLSDYVKRKYVKEIIVAGKRYYFDLSEKTRIYLIKALKGIS